MNPIGGLGGKWGGLDPLLKITPHGLVPDYRSKACVRPIAGLNFSLDILVNEK